MKSTPTTAYIVSYEDAPHHQRLFFTPLGATAYGLWLGLWSWLTLRPRQVETIAAPWKHFVESCAKAGVGPKAVDMETSHKISPAP